MSTIINAKGRPCPMPVIMAKKALDLSADVTIEVDNKVSADNVSAFGKTRGYAVNCTEVSGVFSVRITRDETVQPININAPSCEDMTQLFEKGSFVCALTSECMGRGDDELGRVLMKSFLFALRESDDKPETIVCYNSGVKLAREDSPVLDDLKALEDSGVSVLVCGTCVNFFELTGKIGAGKISNMYDILTVLSAAGRTVLP